MKVLMGGFVRMNDSSGTTRFVKLEWLRLTLNLRVLFLLFLYINLGFPVLVSPYASANLVKAIFNRPHNKALHVYQGLMPSGRKITTGSDQGRVFGSFSLSPSSWSTSEGLCFCTIVNQFTTLETQLWWRPRA